MFVGCDDKEIHKVESSWKLAICFAHHQGFPARELPRRTCDSVYNVKCEAFITTPLPTTIHLLLFFVVIVNSDVKYSKSMLAN